MLTSLGRPALLLAWLSTRGHRSELSTPRCQSGPVHHSGLSTLRVRHTRASLKGSAPTGIAQGNSRRLCLAAGLSTSPSPPFFALRSGAGLQAEPGGWPWVHRFVWLSSPTLGCLQSPAICLPGEDTLPDLLSAELFFCFNSCLGRGRGSLLAAQACPAPSAATRHRPAEQNG